MEEKIRVGAVSYLNTKPLLYGISRADVMQQMELITNYPSAVAGQLLNGTIDIGLVPVAIIPRLSEAFIDSSYCIGATGPVASVCLFSQVPMAQIETVMLDYQSRTSAALVQLLLRDYWKHPVKFVPATPGFENEIGGTTAALVIGDRALELRHSIPHIYDLAEAWIDWTGLPFVFAAWVANKPLPQSFIDAFDAANAEGFNHLPQVIDEHPYEHYDLHTYFTQNISYQFSPEKRAGLELFLTKLKTLEEKPVLENA